METTIVYWGHIYYKSGRPCLIVLLVVLIDWTPWMNSSMPWCLPSCWGGKGAQGLGFSGLGGFSKL